MLDINPEAWKTNQASFSSKVLVNGTSKEEIKAEFLRTYECYETLYSLLKDEETYSERPEPRRLPLLFYFGHTAAFYINKMFDKGIIKERVNAKYQELFATGVDEADWDDMDSTHYDWPTVQETVDYRQKAKKVVLEVINRIDPEISWESDLWSILMGIQHERIHLELTAAIIRRIPIEKISPHREFVDCPLFTTDKSKVPENQLVTIPAFKQVWNRQIKNLDTFGWDNEFGNKTIDVKEFRVSKMLVSNGEFLAFVEDGGYQKKQYWSEEALVWMEGEKPTKPLFWWEGKNGYQLKTLTQLIELPLDWPAEVNYHEADAFCAWKSEKTGVKLQVPTEDEYFAMREHFKGDYRTLPIRSMGNIDMQYWSSPNPVNLFKFGDIYDLMGNVWQLSRTPNHPFQNFQYHELYEDFNTPFFTCKYNIIKGGSFLGNTNMVWNARHSYRKHFHLFMGFRYCVSENADSICEVKEESDAAVELSVKLNYQDGNSYVFKFCERIASNYAEVKGNSLVVGCAVGRIGMECSKIFDHSSSLDFTARFFEVAARMLEKGFMTYKGKLISIEDCNIEKAKNKLIRMNPTNINPGKLATYNFIIFDGFALRPDSLRIAIKNYLPFLNKGGYIAVITFEGRNSISEEEVLALDGSLKQLEALGIGELDGKPISMAIFRQIM